MPRALGSDLRLLAKDPNQRYATATETLGALRTSLLEPEGGASAEAADAVAILDALSRGRLVGRAVELAGCASSGVAREGTGSRSFT